jgi:hypothetical protein
MREKLNENPVYQAALIGILALGVGIMLLMRMGGGGGPTDTASTTTPGVPAVPGAVPTETPATTPAPGDAAPAQSGEAAGGGAGAGEEFVSGPGLPKDVAAAYKDGKVVVLLVVRGNASDDRRVLPMVAALRARHDTAVWLVKAFDVAKYSRITSPVNVDRTPALVVVQPKKLTVGPLPTATVSYGFRSKQSVDQAVRDAFYRGPDHLSYSPNEFN